MFTQSVIEKLGHYVYYLQHPVSGEVFYVGKGVGNRVFEHMSGAVKTDSKTEKLDTIRAIIASGHQPVHYILRHGLSEPAAFEVEAALIDFIGIRNLHNLQAGHKSSDFGIRTAQEIVALYEAEDLSTSEPALLININRLYHRQMTEPELYEATRKSWVLGPRKNNAKYAIATYRGLTREVYRIERWFEVESKGRLRWGFDGVLAAESIRQSLCYKSVSSYFRKGAANPIKYLNC